MKGIALAWAKAGASPIIITGRNEETLKETASELSKVNPNGQVFGRAVDVLDEKAVEGLFSWCKKEFQHIDTLICNVGAVVRINEALKLGEKTTKDWWADIEVNLKGTYLAVHYWLTTFHIPNPKPTDTVIVISSGAATVTLPGESGYCLAKSGMHNLVKSLHIEYPSVRTFSLNPGIVLTDSIPEAYKPWAKDTPELPGGLTVWLAGKKSEFLRGKWISANWDVEELETHQEEIAEKGLLDPKFLQGEGGPEGHPFET